MGRQISQVKLNAHFHERYFALHARFLTRLPDGIAMIDTCLAADRGGDWQGGWRDLHVFAHRLAGTSGSFGLAGLGQAALHLEACLMDAMCLSAVSHDVIDAAIGLRQAICSALVSAESGEGA